ncbi:MAG: hypothetical protein ACI4PQ_01015 [Butyricicoccaceae bacterium]
MSDYLLVLVMNLDALFACAACAASGIRIPFRSRLVIALFGCFSLMVSLAAGGLIASFLSARALQLLAFSVLFLIGLSNLLHQLMQSLLARCHRLTIHMFQYIIDICADETRADADHSRHLSAGEALALALPLSTDSLLTGLSMTEGSPMLLLALAFSCGLIATILGTRLGATANQKNKQFRSVLCGVLFLVLAFGKLI